MVDISWPPLLKTDRGWSVFRGRKSVDAMNAGDENDQYVDFLGAILTKVQMQLKNGNENLFLQFYYVIFFTSTKTIPCVVHLSWSDCVVSLL